MSSLKLDAVVVGVDVSPVVGRIGCCPSDLSATFVLEMLHGVTFLGDGSGVLGAAPADGRQVGLWKPRSRYG
jgi:hypothetical protein